MSNWKRVALMSGVMALLVGCKSRKEVLPLVEVVEMPEDQIEQALSGVTYAELKNAWGSPVAELSGMDGEVFDLGSDNGNLTVYYGNDDRSVVAVKRFEKETEPAEESLLDQAVSLAILEKNQKRYPQEECAGEGHVILRTEGSAESLKVYALTMFGEFQFQDGNFVKAAGSGVIPAVLTFSKDTEKGFVLESFQWSEDGSGYIESIKKLFPDDLWNDCISPSEELKDQLKEMEQSYAKAYLKEIGREAVIGEYRDFEHTLLTDVGVSVEVSNQIMENRELENYPYWIGNVERLEEEIRYVYALTADKENQKIRFTKTQYGKKEPQEIYEFDWKTGEEVKPVKNEGSCELTEGTILTEPPSLTLQDALSSTFNEFELKADTASWNYKQNGQMVGYVSCGSHPLNIAKEKERLKLPRYNQMDSVSYLVFCPVEPDRITVSEYEIADMEHLESAKLISTKTYEEAGFIELKPERGYSIVAEWDKEHLDAYGFYGTGDYSLITE